MIRPLLISALTASPAIAQDTRTWGAQWGSPSHVTIHEPTAPDAVATVTFENTEVHGGNEEFALTFGDITVQIIFDWQADGTSAERITVFAPDGYAAVPPSITVQENAEGVIHIVEWIGG